MIEKSVEQEKSDMVDQNPETRLEKALVEIIKLLGEKLK